MSLNVIKVLSVITFGPKCNKGLECNICSAPHEITVINMWDLTAFIIQKQEGQNVSRGSRLHFTTEIKALHQVSLMPF